MTEEAVELLAGEEEQRAVGGGGDCEDGGAGAAVGMASVEAVQFPIERGWHSKYL